MTLAIIAAHDPNLVIGKDGKLPWHFPDDLVHFKETTMGNPIVMGRGVFEELNERPLEGRENVVLSRTRTYDDLEEITAFKSVSQAISYLSNHDLVFIIGGGEIYRQFMDYADRLYITEIREEFEGDTYFPEYREDVGSIWKEVMRDDREDLSFVIYDRVSD
ncbi:MAG: dihydrofolate reductase [Balneolaceae bacterium]|nr:dihydrofolate reductase [Balneolaceae bacterium]